MNYPDGVYNLTPHVPWSEVGRGPQDQAYNADFAAPKCYKAFQTPFPIGKDLKISVITTMKAYEQLADEGLITAAQGKGFYVNAQDSEMIKEQHLRKVEESLTDAIAAAEVAGISNDELKGMLEALLEVDK
jgi:hypothetical protein